MEVEGGGICLGFVSELSLFLNNDTYLPNEPFSSRCKGRPACVVANGNIRNALRAQYPRLDPL